MLPTSSVGRKILMALTGQVMVLFVIAHVAGNSTIYAGSINAYSAGLHGLPVLLWAVRLVMIAAVFIHVSLGIVLTIENQAAKPRDYAVTRRLRATFAGETMIWTGLVIAAFLIYHLLQFTFQVVNPEIGAAHNPDTLGRPDVFRMLVQSFQRIGISLAYLVSLVALLLHLMHGIQSSLQTWGLNSDRTLPAAETSGTLAAVILFIGYIAIPVVVMMGLIK